MPRLSKAQEHARRAILDAAASGLSPEAFSRRLMQSLTTAIPFDGYRLFAVDSGTLLINRLLAASDSDGWARAEWLRDVYLRADELGYIELPVLMQSGLTAVAMHETQETCWGYRLEVLATIDPANHRRLFHELRSPVGGTLLACFPAEGRWVGAMQAYRRDPKSPFRVSDVAFVQSMAATIGKALAAALAREQARATASPEDEAAGILIVGPNGRPTFSTPAGEEWCRRIVEPGLEEHGPIPTAVWAAIARLRGEGGASASLVVPAESGLVRIEASPAGLDGSVAIVLAPQRPPSLPEAPLEWPLTSGERRVVDLALRGLTNAQIADKLFLSVNTVEWHLRGAYEKLGVRSRTGLLARLFNDLAPPGLLETEPAERAEAGVATRP
jgi:DNA-binding CsgD family transcriptional regulator